MKFFLTLLSIAVINSGCSFKNGFSKFNMTKEQELSADSLQSSKILNNNGLQGIFSAIYLNKIYPKAFNKDEYFFVFYYIKDQKEMHNPNLFDNKNTKILLNSKEAIKIKELPNNNQFSDLVSVKNKWTKYYIVAFKESGDVLNLVIKNNNSSSQTLRYMKKEE
jgi:hypothetical protein